VNGNGPTNEDREPRHIVRQFDTELDELRSLVLRMGRLVVEQIRDASESLLHEQPDAANTVLRREDWVDSMEIEADDRIVELLVRRQPLGQDLRSILALGKTVRDLERMGDEAERIARVTLDLHSRSNNAKPGREFLRDVEQMTDMAIKLVEGCLSALGDLDLEQAVLVAQGDGVLDSDFSAALRHLATFLFEDSRMIGLVINVTFVLKALERIGDHATNIAEHVIFLIKGKDVRHLGSAALDRVLKSGES
jgi:phosphate transport system protein